MKWKKGSKNIKLADLSMLFLLIATVISTLQSDFKYESFWVMRLDIMAFSLADLWFGIPINNEVIKI